MDDNKFILEVNGTVENIIYRNEQNGYTVLEIATEYQLITAVGTVPMLSVGESVKVMGNYISHKNYGEQFKIEAIERSTPENLEGILKYLSSGTVKGIGPSTATKLVKRFGIKTLEILENEPEKVAKIKGITLKKAEDISQQLKQQMGIRELITFLSPYDITSRSILLIYKEYGNNSINLIKENPYILCTNEFNISFNIADEISLSLDIPRNEHNRIRAAIMYVLKHNELNGHTCLPKDRLTETTAAFVNQEIEVTEANLKHMLEDSSLVEEDINGREFIFTLPMHKTETYIAMRLEMLMRYPATTINNVDSAIEKIEKIENIKYADLQKTAIKNALEKGLLILTGGPGTGKTTTLNAIIKILMDNGQTVLLAAPTGRAAQRMSELTHREAKTIHRLLEVNFDSKDEPSFVKNENNLLKCDALVLDEASMIDAKLFESVMKALPLGCRLILVGDSHQLPSVGPGNVLADLIASSVIPYVELNEIFRQSMQSLIVTNAHKIVNGKEPIITTKDSDFFFIASHSYEEAANIIADLYTKRLPQAYGYNSLKDIQVISPTKKNTLGTSELNDRLQSIVNPKSEHKKELRSGFKILREGDKVMQVKNDYDIIWESKNGKSGEGIFNGDIGILRDINKSEKIVTVEYDDKIAVYNEDQLLNLELSYACTVHKSQGNEFEAVIMPVFHTAPQLMYRNLLYTAVTRAKKLLILVGSENAITKMIENNKGMARYTGLRYFFN